MSYAPYFIHFGCWNNGYCPDNNDMTKVTNAIKSLDPKPEFLSICGDNYYPTTIKNKEKGDKKKYLEIANLRSGFECLPNDLPIYMTYGNHDYETGLFIGRGDGIETQETNCTLTREELNLVSSRLTNIKLKLFQSVSFQDNTEVLFLDTTIYDDDDVSENIPCYQTIDVKYTDIGSVKTAQLQFIQQFVSSIIAKPNVRNVIIVGHHPLIQYKYKKDKMKILALSPELNELLYNEIYLLLPKDIKYYYLCADLHQFQSGNILINDVMAIKQYIVGTAGAKKDDVYKDLIDTSVKTIENISYSMDTNDIDQMTDQNGYLKCISNADGLSFEFVKVIDDIVGGNKIKGRRKSRRKNINGRRSRRKSRKNRRKK